MPDRRQMMRIGRLAAAAGPVLGGPVLGGPVLGDPVLDEQVTFLRAGIDGLFTDQADIGALARQLFAAG